MTDNSHKNTPRHIQGSTAPKYSYHDEPHSFEATVDYVVVASNTTNSELQDVNDNNLSSPLNTKLSTSNTVKILDDDNDNEIVYTNTHFKFEVLETTV
jgi:hypothetical protein